MVSKAKLNAIIAIFVMLTSARYISTKLMDELEVVDSADQIIEDRHPVLQSIAGYFGEFVFALLLGCYYKRYYPEKVKPSDTVSFFTLSLPAFCDFFENMCLIFGITQIFPSLVTMSRALVLPITAVLSRILIRKLFNWKMIAALCVLLAGMTLATFVQYEGEMSSDEFKLTTVGIVLLCLSATIQSLEIIIENRLFIIDPNMSTFYMFGAVAAWKMIFTVLILPFCSLIKVPEEYVTGGRFESLGPAISLIFRNSSLCWLFIIMSSANGLHAIFGIEIIKGESAMQRQIAMMLVTPTVWVFFLLYSGEGQESFNWKQLLGLFLLIIGIFWYIMADRKYGEELVQNEYLLKNDMKFKEGEEGVNLLEEGQMESIDNEHVMTSEMDDDNREEMPKSARLLNSKKDYEEGAVHESGST